MRDSPPALPGSSPVTALHGTVVLDFSHVIAGPFATHYLAMLGARVIKVENPHRGDPLRRNAHGFASFNHGKEIVSIDLATAAGREAAWALLAECNVMVDNMRPGVLEAFGLGEAAVRARHPALIHCAISGYGRGSDGAAWSAYDHVIQAASGMSLMSGGAGDGPIKVGFPVVDGATGILAALAIVAAIRRRDLTGAGESIDVSMMGAALQLMYSATVDVMATGQGPERVGNVGYTGSPGAANFECRDGLLALGANTPQQMRRLAEVLGLTAEIESLLAGQTRGFVQASHGEAMSRLLRDALRTRSAAELEPRLNAVGVPAARVRDLEQAVSHAIERGSIDPWILPEAEPVPVPGLGFRARTLFGGQASPFAPAGTHATGRTPADAPRAPIKPPAPIDPPPDKPAG